jgi:hypothetical protein
MKEIKMASKIEFQTSGKPQIVLARNSGRNFNLSLEDYAYFLREANRIGWEPYNNQTASFSPECFFYDDPELPMIYPEFGKVSAKDAKGIVKALKTILNQADKFMSSDEFELEIHNHLDLEGSDFDHFWNSCGTASDVIRFIDGFLVIRPRNSAIYLLTKKEKVLKNFLEFCELGEFQIFLVVNKWR